jgi:hypothetical protein
MKKFLTVVMVAIPMITGVVIASAPAQAATGADILGTYHDAAGRTIYYRNGTYNGSVGFGWQKISQKHAITS